MFGGGRLIYDELGRDSGQGVLLIALCESGLVVLSLYARNSQIGRHVKIPQTKTLSAMLRLKASNR